MAINSLETTPSFSSESLPSDKNKPSRVAGAAAPSLPDTKQPPVQGPKLVYVVENDRISSVITTLIVQKNLFGGEVQRYANGQQAFNDLKLALQDGVSLPDLVVMDLDMPLMDGWELLDALVDLAPASPIPVFVLTSSIHPDDQAKALSYKQVKGFFTKPLKEPEVARMQSLLRGEPNRAT